MKKTLARLADGRELIYFDNDESAVREAPDLRPLDRVRSHPELRRDEATGDWITIASHRQGRTYHPPAA